MAKILKIVLPSKTRTGAPRPKEYPRLVNNPSKKRGV